MYYELDLRLTAEQAAIREAAHHFALKVLRPAAARLDRLDDPEAVIVESSLLWGVLRQAYRPLPRRRPGEGRGGDVSHALR